MKAYIRADEEPEIVKQCLMNYMDHWDTISDVVKVYRGQNYPTFKTTPLISVSISMKAAKEFATNSKRGRVFTLYLHPGVRYLDFNAYYDAIGIVSYTHEAEYVIAGNSEFRPRKDDPLIIDVYPALELLEPVQSDFVKLYDMSGPDKRLLQRAANINTVDGGSRLRQKTRRLRLRRRQRSQRTRK
jgi:hypothetical protein